VLHQDSIQERLNSVNRRLARPAFLRDLSCSRLPSQAASDSSLSPGEVPPHIQQAAAHSAAQASRRGLGPHPHHPGAVLQQSPLHLAVDFATPYPELDSFLALSEIPHNAKGIEAAVLEHDFKGGEAVPEAEWDDLEKLRNNYLAAWNTLIQFRLPFVSTSAKMATDRGFSTFEHEHNDLVLAVDFNFYGTRMVTASSDHRLKVFDKKDESWTLIDTWRAHDAEVVDVKWNGPFAGAIIGSIGEDGYFNLWEEDALEPPHSQRRFRKIYRLRTETKVPFCSLDFKNLHTETYIALITRDGHLSLLEPVDHDNLGGEWQAINPARYVCDTPSRQDETSFRVAWHKEKVPCWTAVEAGLDRRSLSLAVAAMKTVQIYRTDKERQFYLAAELTGSRQIVRDVAWANGSMRGYDVIATASKDGLVRVYELHTPYESPSKTGTDSMSGSATPPAGKAKISAPSGLTAGLTSTPSSVRESRDLDKSLTPGQIRHEVKMVAEMPNAHGGSVWRVAFTQLGKEHCLDILDFCSSHQAIS